MRTRTGKRLLAAILLGIVARGLATAQEAPSPKRTVIHAGKLLEVRSGRLLADQAIVIEADKIVSVGPAGAIPASSSDSRVDLSKATVLPGLIDAHTHLTVDPGDVGYEGLGISVPRETLIGARNARLTLEAGITTVRNVGAEAFTDVALRDAVRDGDIPGPRMRVSGPPLGITGGHCDNNFLPAEYHASAGGVADGISAVQHKVRENIKYGADLIKVCATGGVLSLGDDPQASQYTLEELQAIVDDAHRLGRKVAAHAHGAQGILWAARNRFHRTGLLPRRCRHRRDEEKRYLSGAHAISV
jgi:imidazolonepropionase-like amidohydrolase